MTANGSVELTDASSGGVSGEHPLPDPFQILVGPSTEDQKNTVQLPLVAVACWGVDDIRFAFDSSFVTSDIAPDSSIIPEDIRAELRHLSALIAKHPTCPLSIFGHADPVGDDVYNKSLSERRARAIYALLIFKTEPDTSVSYWQQISATEHWGSNQRKTMETFTGLPQGTLEKTLIRSYLEKLSAPGPLLGKADFLGQGAGPDRKADFQGCSEFNPLVLFSQQKQDGFDQAKRQNDVGGIADRNLQNAPNRRVMGLLFKKGSRVEPTKWPCPRASQGISDCVRQFFPDGDTRRSTHLPDLDRSFQVSKDTFACRFYQRMTHNSPCEAISRRPIRIWLLDEQGQHMPVGTPYRLTLPNTETVREAELRIKGLLVEAGLPETDGCFVEWAEMQPNSILAEEEGDRLLRDMVGATAPDHPFLFGTVKEAKTYRYHAYVVVDTIHAEVEDETQAKARLNNMAYADTDAIEDNLLDFEDDYDLPHASPKERKLTLRDYHRDGTEMPLQHEILNPINDGESPCYEE